MNKLVIIGYVLAIFTHYINANAACLGLDPPTPKTTNICERLVERLIVPRTEVFCDIPGYARVFMPHCNLPGACHVDPTCKLFEQVRKIGETVLNAGELYCDFRKIAPEKIIEGIGNQTYTDLVKLTSHGTSSILFDIANRHVDIMSCNGSQLNEKLKGWIKCVTSKSTVSQDEYFYPIDVNRVNIISKTNPTADLYLKQGFNAITLNDLVIMEDAGFQTLKNWNKNVGETLNLDEQHWVSVMIHELVHVRQYRNMGKEVFVNRYLTEAMIKGYANISMEQQAGQYQSWARSILAMPNLCAVNNNNQQIPRPPNPQPSPRVVQCRSNQHCCEGTNQSCSPGQCIANRLQCP